MSEPRYYTGIGSRSTPSDVLALMQKLACALADKGWTLRSGCAPGADSAFEYGACFAQGELAPRPEFYLPWPGFERRATALATRNEASHEAMEIAQLYHPAWHKCSPKARLLHGRNSHQILGPYPLSDPKPSAFVICWTKGGKREGGTGQALRIAEGHGIAIFDLAIDSARERVGGLLV